jgi:phytoene synthase
MPSPALRITHARPADSAACREMIRCGSRSFFMASLLLPADVREAAYALYAFCRLSDDAVDVEGGEADAVARLRARLDGVFAGRPGPDPVDRALTDAVLRFGLPRAAMDALLEGLEWDAAGRTYETISDVYAYGARVAGSVGALMAALMGARSPDLVSRACDLGVAMQLTNIARDVGEDARAGRLYLPRAWMREAGIDPELWLADPVFNPAIGQVVARMLAHADDLYARADAGIAHLDPGFRPAIFAARHLYAGIGHRLAARGLDSISRRTVLSTGRKLRLLARAVACAAAPPRLSPAGPPLEETRFLVGAVGLATPWPGQASVVSHKLADDVAWTIDLFAMLEQRGRVRKAAADPAGVPARVG